MSLPVWKREFYLNQFRTVATDLLLDGLSMEELRGALSVAHHQAADTRKAVEPTEGT